ncbi:MAG: hypothetical protein ACR2FS_12955, partial [Phormidesmis sp.]
MQPIIKLLSGVAVGLSISCAAWWLDGSVNRGNLALPASLQSAWDRTASRALELPAPIAQITLPASANTYFGAVAGGGAPSYNE